MLKRNDRRLAAACMAIACALGGLAAMAQSTPLMVESVVVDKTSGEPSRPDA